METGNSSGNSETSGARQALAAAGQVIDKLGVMDLAVPAVRRQLERVDVDALFDDAIDYIRRKPEVLVVLLGGLTITSGLIVFLAKNGEELAASTRSAARRVAAAVEGDEDDDDGEDDEEGGGRSRSVSSSSSSKSSKGTSRRSSSSKR